MQEVQGKDVLRGLEDLDVAAIGRSLLEFGESMQEVATGLQIKTDYSAGARSVKPHKIAAAKKRHAKKKANRRNKR